MVGVCFYVERIWNYLGNKFLVIFLKNDLVCGYVYERLGYRVG